MTALPLVISLAVQGTLVVVIPTAGGLVIAADGRSTVHGVQIDGVRKLHVVETRRPILITITGSSDFAGEPPLGADLRDWILNSSYPFRGSDVVQAFLSRLPDPELTSSLLARIAETLAHALEQYLRSLPCLIEELRDRELCRLAVFQAVSGTPRVSYGWVVLRMNTSGQVTAATPEFMTTNPSDVKKLYLLGEDKYTLEQVVGGRGQQFLTDDATRGWNAATLAKDLTPGGAAAIAAGIIRAAELTSTLVPIPSGNGIGGPIQAFLVSPEGISAIMTAR